MSRSFLAGATTVFVAGFCSMALEIAASRILAPRLGVSLYTWTTNLGVVLTGIAIGNYLGGRLADRRPSTTTLGAVLLASSGSTWLVLVVAAIGLDPTFLARVPIVGRVVLLYSMLLLAPGLALGVVTPVVSRLTVADLTRSGGTVGALYAWSTAGAIAGTLATGFVLIETLGTRALVGVLTALLFAAALAAGRLWSAPRRFAPAGAVGLVLVGATLVFRVPLLSSPCERETSYFCIKVIAFEDGDPANPSFGLVLDHLFHSRVTPSRPETLSFSYIRAYADVMAVKAERKPDFKALMIGGGGYVLPRYLEAVYPRSELHVVEIDPEVTRVNYEKLGLPRDTRVQTHFGDARVFMMGLRPTPTFDIVFGDAFNDLSVPYHLTTLELDRIVDRLLTDDGIYLVNVIDQYRSGALLRSFLNTFAEVFPYVYLMRAGAYVPDHIETLVVGGSRQPLDLGPFTNPDAYQLGRAITTTVTTGADLDAYRRSGSSVILTDDYVPVDQLTAPLFVQRDS